MPNFKLISASKIDFGLPFKCQNGKTIIFLRVLQYTRTVTDHETKGRFPLMRKFYVRTGVNSTGFTCVNLIRDDV